jgi:heat-inducible transcriptional repressor
VVEVDLGTANFSGGAVFIEEGFGDRSEGVRIFIGSENNLFSLSGSSMIAAPFRDGKQKIVGVLGVIGPTRLNYARIVPIVDYTAKVVGRLLG